MKTQTLVMLGIGGAALLLLNSKKSAASNAPKDNVGNGVTAASGQFVVYDAGTTPTGVFNDLQSAAAWADGRPVGTAVIQWPNANPVLWIKQAPAPSGGGGGMDWNPMDSPYTGDIISTIGSIFGF